MRGSNAWDIIKLGSDSWIGVFRNFLLPSEKNAIRFHSQAASAQWVDAWGKKCLTPRKVANFGDGTHFYGGVEHKELPVPEDLRAIVSRGHQNLPGEVKRNLAERPWGLLVLNLYEKASDCIKAHSDGPHTGVYFDDDGNSLVMSFSVGGNATMRFTEKRRGGMKKDIILMDGDYLVMGGRTNTTFLHEVLPRPSDTTRWNLTARTVDFSPKLPPAKRPKV